MYTCRPAQKLYKWRCEVANLLLLFLRTQNILKGYFIVCKCSVRLGLHDSRVEICGCVYKRRVEIKREEFNKAFSHNPHLLFGKGFYKVHNEPFESGLNCFHSFFSIFQLGLNSQSGLSTVVEIQPGCHVNAQLFFVRVELKFVKST